jgi:hypothetical protein
MARRAANDEFDDQEEEEDILNPLASPLFLTDGVPEHIHEEPTE